MRVMMEGRRFRRFGARPPTQSALPIFHAEPSLTSNTISCCYCDYKVSALSHPLFCFGQRHARCFRLWFSIGVGFSLTALLAVALILLWQLAIILHLLDDNFDLTNLSASLLFGFSPTISGLSLSLADIGYVSISTLISVAVHELGHTLAAASEGLQMEYIAVFIAFLFPGALVAFNCDLLQALPRFAALRIYCAGIWHNAVCCAVSGLALFLLPLILSPIYIHGESPMVLDVPSVSPLSIYLSPGDIIFSVDGIRIHDAQQWMERTALADELARENSNYSVYANGFRRINNSKGYCVPSPIIEESKKIHLVDNQVACPNDLTAFVTISCFGLSKLDDFPNRRESMHCLAAQDVVKLTKCGDGWVNALSNGSSCMCSQDEFCSTPIEMPGFKWVEITYLSPYSPECSQEGRKKFLAFDNLDSLGSTCGGTFVFIGDIISMAHSLQLTAYHPRWAFLVSTHLPHVLEKSLTYMFHVSITLALLNSLPIYFLDGESILEVYLCYLTLLSPRKKRRVLQVCLLGGTIISIVSFLRIFFSNIL